MNLPPQLRLRYFDANGIPLAGGLVYSYQAGTTTPQATYTDQSGATQNTNPLVLDSQGYGTMWLDPTLSYKFVLEDSNNNVQWTLDNVVGLLTQNAVNTASIQDGAVTSSKLASGSVNVTNNALASDSSVDANRPVNTNNIRNGAITAAKLAAGAISYPQLSFMVAPTVQTFLTGSGNYNKTYMFFVNSCNASSGATYTNNSNTYTVVTTVSGATVLQTTGSADPLASGTLTLASGTGDTTITFNSFRAPLFIDIEMQGGGGGGAGGGTSQPAGGNGGNTTFGTLTANGGTAAGGGGGGAGGTVVAIGSGYTGNCFAGGSGGGSGLEQSIASYPSGGMGAASPFGGAGGGGRGTSTPGTGGAGAANTGSGGGGGGTQDSGTSSGGGGGGAGAYVTAQSSGAVLGSIAYSIGTAGTAGTAGSSGAAGGAGGSGIIIITEYFQ